MRERFYWGGFMKKTSIFISLLAFVTCFLLSTNIYADGVESVVSNGQSHDEIKRGERFFKGLLPFDRDHASCVSCHNIAPVDTLNWNPSAMDIALKYVDRDFESFQASIMNPTGIKMSASHVNFDIEEEDLKTVKTYLDNLAHTGIPAPKPTYNNLILFLFLGLLIIWAIVELIFLRRIKLKIIPLLILFGAFGWQVKMIVTNAIKLGRQENYQPKQPIKFSHQVHAGLNQTDCFYCHNTAEYSKSAGIPSANVCINCHLIVREGTNSGKFEIDKIHHAFDNDIPIEWIRVHNLPDHVFFSHAQHVGVGKLDCKECHGPVEEMDVLRQHSDLSMGWCLDCHKTKKVQFVENDYYKTYKEFHDQITAGLIDSVTVEQIGGTDCMKCHY